MRPYLRVKNVFEDRIDLTDVMEMDFSPTDYERYKLESGDILLNEGQSSELVGRPAMFKGELPSTCFTNSLIRFRPHDGISRRYALFLFRYYLRSGRFRKEARITTNIAHLSARRFSSIEFPIPPEREQQRIVEVIEEQFSRLDAGIESLERAKRNLAWLRASILATAVGGKLLAPVAAGESSGARSGDDWCETTVEQVLSEPLSNGRSVKDAEKGFPVLRLTALRNGKIDLSRRKTGDWTQAEGAPFVVRRGDFLISRGNGSLHLVGRGGLVADDPDPVAFPDLLIRLRPNLSVLDPRFLGVLWESPVIRRQVEAAARTTAGIYKISQRDIRRFVIRFPAIDEQRRITAEVERRFSILDAMGQVIEGGLKRAAGLRLAILREAFAGRLVPQDPSDEPAAALLERVRAERAKT